MNGNIPEEVDSIIDCSEDNGDTYTQFESNKWSRFYTRCMGLLKDIFKWGGIVFLSLGISAPESILNMIVVAVLLVIASIIYYIVDGLLTDELYIITDTKIIKYTSQILRGDTTKFIEKNAVLEFSIHQNKVMALLDTYRIQISTERGHSSLAIHNMDAESAKTICNTLTHTSTDIENTTHMPDHIWDRFEYVLDSQDTKIEYAQKMPYLSRLLNSGIVRLPVYVLIAGLIAFLMSFFFENTILYSYVTQTQIYLLIFGVFSIKLLQVAILAYIGTLWILITDSKVCYFQKSGSTQLHYAHREYVPNYKIDSGMIERLVGFRNIIGTGLKRHRNIMFKQVPNKEVLSFFKTIDTTPDVELNNTND